MSNTRPDQIVLHADWSDLRRHLELPQVDIGSLHSYRRNRLKQALDKADAAMCLLVNPISLRYAVDYRTYALFQSHVPTTYLFVPLDGPTVIHGAFSPLDLVDEVRPARALTFYDGGEDLAGATELLADDIVDYLQEIGSDSHRVAVELVSPTLAHALIHRGLEVIDGGPVSESARVIKSEDEILCMRWAIAVAEFGIDKLRETIAPGVSELELWALLNYVNLVNDGDWHDGRMLASGPRINPWCQEASQRQVQSGDLIAFDTDMAGPFGYFADISRTFHCGPAKPTGRQKQLYRLAHEEIEHNMKLIRPGVTLREFQQQAWQPPEEFLENAYGCVIHGVGMCDEYPRVNPAFRGPNPYDGTLEAGMAICVESYIGAVGEREGVKLEQQVLVTEDGHELLSNYPLEEQLLD